MLQVYTNSKPIIHVASLDFPSSARGTCSGLKTLPLLASTGCFQGGWKHGWEEGSVTLWPTGWDFVLVFPAAETQLRVQLEFILTLVTAEACRTPSQLVQDPPSATLVFSWLPRYHRPRVSAFFYLPLARLVHSCCLSPVQIVTHRQ